MPRPLLHPPHLLLETQWLHEVPPSIHLDSVKRITSLIRLPLNFILHRVTTITRMTDSSPNNIPEQGELARDTKWKGLDTHQLQFTAKH